MNQGRIEQIGTPEEIYSRPATAFVADFIGITRFMRGVVEEVVDFEKGRVSVITEDELRLTVTADLGRVKKGSRVLVVVRPDYISLASEGDKINVFEATVDRATYTGDSVDYEIKLGKWDLRFRTAADVRFAPGTTIRIRIDGNKAIAIPE